MEALLQREKLTAFEGNGVEYSLSFGFTFGGWGVDVLFV